MRICAGEVSIGYGGMSQGRLKRRRSIAKGWWQAMQALAGPHRVAAGWTVSGHTNCHWPLLAPLPKSTLQGSGAYSQAWANKSSSEKEADAPRGRYDIFSPALGIDSSGCKGQEEGQQGERTAGRRRTYASLLAPSGALRVQVRCPHHRFSTTLTTPALTASSHKHPAHAASPQQSGSCDFALDHIS
ncbi:hypothetical protein V2G26_011811 [Clonostachys chloroleuca]